MLSLMLLKWRAPCSGSTFLLRSTYVALFGLFYVVSHMLRPVGNITGSFDSLIDVVQYAYAMFG